MRVEFQGSARDAEMALLATSWLASYGSENTRSAYGGDLRAFARWCDDRGRLAVDANAADIARYLAWSERSGVSGATLARRRSALTSFFEFTRQANTDDTDHVGGIPAVSPSPSSATAVLGDQDAQALLRAADRCGPKTATLVRLLMVDGLRLGEILATDVDDLRRKSGSDCLVVRRHERDHAVPLSAPTSRRLRDYLGRRRSGPLLLSDTRGREGARLTRFGADYLLKEVGRAARITRVSANTLRRRYVVAAAKAGTHIDDIRDRLGHRDIRTTRRYLDPDDHSSTTSSGPSAPTKRR